MYVDPLEHESIREFVWTWGIPAYPPLLYANLRGKMMILRMVDVPEFVCMYCTHVDLLSSHLKMMLNLCVQEGLWYVASDKGLHAFPPCTIASYHYIHIHYLYVSYYIHHIVLIAKKSAWITKLCIRNKWWATILGKKSRGWNIMLMGMDHFCDPQNLRCWSILNRKPGKAHHIFWVPDFDSPDACEIRGSSVSWN